MDRPEIDIVVSQYATGLLNQFMATRILPPLKKVRRDGTVYIVPIGNVTLSTGDLKRHPKTGYVRIETGTGKISYCCEPFGIEEPIDNDEWQDIVDKFGHELDTAELLTLYVMRAQEKRVATVVFDTAVIPSGAVGTKWNNASGKAYTDILDGVSTLKKALGGAIGAGEICLALSGNAFDVVINNAEIKSKQGGGAGTIKNQLKMTETELAGILKINEVTVSDAQSAVVKDGEMTDIWDNTKALLHVRYSGEQTRAVAHFGRTVQWTGRSPNMYNTDIYLNEALDGRVVRVRQNVDELVHTPKAGYIFTTIQ